MANRLKISKDDCQSDLQARHFSVLRWKPGHTLFDTDSVLYAQAVRTLTTSEQGFNFVNT